MKHSVLCAATAAILAGCGKKAEIPVPAVPPTAAAPSAVRAWSPVGDLVGFRKDGKLVVAVKAKSGMLYVGEIVTVDTSDGRCTVHPIGNERMLRVELCGDGDVVLGSPASGFARAGETEACGDFLVYDYAKAAVRKTVRAPYEGMLAPDGTAFVTVGKEKDAIVARVRAAYDGGVEGRLEITERHTVVPGPAGKQLLVAHTGNGELSLVEVAERTEVADLARFRHCRALGMTANGHVLLGADRYSVVVVDRKGQILALTPANESWIANCAVSPDGRRIASFSTASGEIGVFEGPEATVVRKVKMPVPLENWDLRWMRRQIAFTPDGRTVLVAHEAVKGVARVDIAEGRVQLPPAE